MFQSVQTQILTNTGFTGQRKRI